MTVVLDAETLLLLEVQRRGDSVSHRRPVLDRRQFADRHAVGVAIPFACSATSSASRVLPTPPTPVSVTTGPSRSAAPTFATSLLASDEASRAPRQIRRAAGVHTRGGT